ncbi:transcriptional activator protein Pur-alpha isoform X1 [Lepeophtheirus salmonis]|uniref:transcriptional activator protein Pur-alpha isoform X1 n=1 Tax=Lepeophtheirus salmonis TaxID=72036 RepID=UPI001AEB8EF5|nr:transcriptional activator protein Pur-alpha-like isoform X1 [Lepeophtheirus salmonis]
MSDRVSSDGEDPGKRGLSSSSLKGERNRGNESDNEAEAGAGAAPWEHQEMELASKMIQIQSKRFYLDVKLNQRGKFIKIAEIGTDGRRSQIFLALSTAADFRDNLYKFGEFYTKLGPPNPEVLPENGKLKSEMMVKDNRRYYLDLKENARGRYLRVSQTISRGGHRSQIAIPAQGMVEFRDALTDLVDQFGESDLTDGHHLRVDNKNFYFDIGQNNRGTYMKISEVKSNSQTSITIPEKSWTAFRDVFDAYLDKTKETVDAEKENSTAVLEPPEPTTSSQSNGSEK